MKLPPSLLLERYISNPLKYDVEVRRACDVPDNRYYTVSIWPVAGVVTVDNRERVKPTTKISKSSQ